MSRTGEWIDDLSGGMASFLSVLRNDLSAFRRVPLRVRRALEHSCVQRSLRQSLRIRMPASGQSFFDGLASRDAFRRRVGLDNGEADDFRQRRPCFVADATCCLRLSELSRQHFLDCRGYSL